VNQGNIVLFKGLLLIKNGGEGQSSHHYMHQS